MSTYDERLAALEQTSVTRTEFTRAIDNLTRQHGRALSDRNQETTISLGVLTDDVRILKENVTSLRLRMNEGFNDLSQELYSMEERFDKRFGSLEDRVGSFEDRIERRFISLENRFSSLEARFSEQSGLLTQILARLPEKS